MYKVAKHPVRKLLAKCFGKANTIRFLTQHSQPPPAIHQPENLLELTKASLLVRQ